jgi:hypothetical protein
MSTYYDDKIRKLELQILILQAENLRLNNALKNAAVAHYVPMGEELRAESAARHPSKATAETIAEWS